MVKVEAEVEEGVEGAPLGGCRPPSSGAWAGAELGVPLNGQNPPSHGAVTGAGVRVKAPVPPECGEVTPQQADGTPASGAGMSH